MITINLNTIFEVELTDKGVQIYTKYIADNSTPLYVDLGNKTILEIRKTKRLKMELWHLMNIFGPHLYNGCEIPFKDNFLTKE